MNSVIRKLFDTFPTLVMEKYNLREIHEGDYKDIFEIYSDGEVLKYENMPPFNHINDAKVYIRTIKKGYKEKRFIRWVIEDREIKKVLGLVTLHHIDYINFNAHIGYILNRNYWGKGIMKQVGNKILQHSFEEVGLHRIEAHIDPRNNNSIKLIEKLQFEKDGLLKESAFNYHKKVFEDRVLYSKLKFKKKHEKN